MSYTISLANIGGDGPMKDWTPHKEVSNIDGFRMKEDLGDEVLGWLGACYISISKEDYKRFVGEKK